MHHDDQDGGNDLDLIGIEMETLWDFDESGRLLDAHHVVVGATAEGLVAAVGADLPDALARRLEQLLAEATEHHEPGRPPASILRCREVLESAGERVQLSSGPSYLVPPTVRCTGTAEIIRSDSADARSLRGANPESWTDTEWTDLLDGRLGPWAIATQGGRVIARCVTPVSSQHGAEAGVWTHPDFRGQGHAATVTAHWASLFSPGSRRLFYSTSAENLSSQRVAARLDLQAIGWLWKLSRPGEQGRHAHRPWMPGTTRSS